MTLTSIRLETIHTRPTTSNEAPTYQASQQEYITRVQHRPTSAKGLSSALQKNRFASSSDHDLQHGTSMTPWSFSGWGTIIHATHLDLEVLGDAQNGGSERRTGKTSRSITSTKDETEHGTLCSLLGLSISAVAVAGSPFYAFPAVVAVAGVWSPVSLLAATLLLGLWRPIMRDLARAIPIDGANYIYLLNSTTTFVALVAAALTILDDLATGVVSAATAASYVTDQMNGELPFDRAWLTVIILLAVGAVGILGVTQGARVTLVMFLFHMATMITLFIAAIVYWIKNHSATLASNWIEGNAGMGSSSIAKSIFQGICIGFLAVTGFETSPDYISSLRSNIYPSVLRNLQIISVVLNAPLLLVIYAVLPSNSIVGNPSVLSTLAEVVGGKWMGYWVLVDAIVILSGGILTGTISASAICLRLTKDRMLPSCFSRPLPITGIPFVSLLLFIFLSLAIWATSGGSLDVVSGMFAITFLSLMALYPLSSLILLFSRSTLLPASHRSHSLTSRNSLLLASSTLLLSIILIIGNLQLSPVNAGYFAAYAAGILLVLLLCAKKGEVAQGLWKIAVLLSGGHPGSLASRGMHMLVEWVRGNAVERCVVVLSKSDDIDQLFKMILYVKTNEDMVDRIKLVHVYRSEEMIPSEMIANAKRISSHCFARPVLDEAFPSITIDLVLLLSPYNLPTLQPTPYPFSLNAAISLPIDTPFHEILDAIAPQLEIYSSRWFIASPHRSRVVVDKADVGWKDMLDRVRIIL